MVWFVGYNVVSRRESRREDASEAFTRAVRMYDAPLVADGETPKTDDENPLPRFKTESDRATGTMTEIDQVKKKYAGTKLAEQLQLFSAGVLFDSGRYEDAAKLYDSYLATADRASITGILAQESRGLCAEAEGKLDEAMSAFMAIETATELHRNDFYRDRVLYNQARIKVKKGDLKGAGELYQQILSKIPGTALREQVQTQLALLGTPGAP